MIVRKYVFQCVECRAKNETYHPPNEDQMLNCKRCGFMTVQTLFKVKLLSRKQ